MLKAKWLAAAWLIWSSQLKAECPSIELQDPGPLPLIELLVEYLPDDPVFGKGLRKVTLCDQQAWDLKRSSVRRRVERMMGRLQRSQGRFCRKFSSPFHVAVSCGRRSAWRAVLETELLGIC